jgi:hypothetical protein
MLADIYPSIHVALCLQLAGCLRVLGAAYNPYKPGANTTGEAVFSSLKICEHHGKGKIKAGERATIAFGRRQPLSDGSTCFTQRPSAKGLTGLTVSKSQIQLSTSIVPCCLFRLFRIWKYRIGFPCIFWRLNSPFWVPYPFWRPNSPFGSPVFSGVSTTLSCPP